MSTRQLRLNSREQMRRRLEQFIGKKINIVLNDRSVMLIMLERFDNDIVTGLNMRLKGVTVPFEKISEIYFDTYE